MRYRSKSIFYNVIRDFDYSAELTAIKNHIVDWPFYNLFEQTTICIVLANRGHCKLLNKHFYISVPKWVFDRQNTLNETGRATQYLAHELAHALCYILYGPNHNHDQYFMHCLKKLCPPEFLHWELTYKPRNATNAGIRKSS